MLYCYQKTQDCMYSSADLTEHILKTVWLGTSNVFLSNINCFSIEHSIEEQLYMSQHITTSDGTILHKTTQMH